MSTAATRKQDKDMQIVADISLGHYEWEAYRVVRDDDGLYLMTDSGCSCYSPFEYFDAPVSRDFLNKTGEQFMDHATGPLTRFQALAELMSLLDVSDRYDWDEGGINEKEVEEAVRAILATNINTTSLTKEEEA